MSGTGILSRVAAKIDFNGDGGCWVWKASLNKAGYGQVRYLGQTRLAHRSVYRMVVGEIPDGLDLDHLCRNPPCVNPKHLEPVTRRENTLRGDGLPAIRARITHCPQGHLYDEVNTLNCRDGKRYCRTCNRDKARARKAASQ